MRDFLLNQVLVFLSLWPLFVWVISILLILFFIKNRHTKNKCKPIDETMPRRPAGQSLFEQMDDASSDIGYYLGLSLAVPCAPFATNFMLNGDRITLYIFLIVAVLAEIFILKSMIKLIRRRWNNQIGYQCEVATAVQLDQLMKRGFEVFHDVQMEGFNIDHLVIGPNGVFAIETKGRHKTVIKNAKGDHEKHYQLSVKNEHLVFPSWTEVKPIMQAQRQAKAVTKWLTEATGEPIHAKPVLVFPGWYVKQETKPTMPIVNHKQLPNHLPKFFGLNLTQNQIRKIVFQVEKQNTYYSKVRLTGNSK